MKHTELRKLFFDYFKGKGHTIVPSSPLVPLDDPSMLFTTAGMVQFKPLFAGIVELPYTRATSVQKCFRLSDFENIGRTARHHTFFEMFGNFSFGDYFKKGAIEFAWEFSTEVLKLPKERIYISIFENDEDAFKIWNEHIGVPKDKIVRLGKKDNFWGPAGDSGACGPCSELYIDMGEEKSCGSPDCAVGCDCERYLEYWNLVFNEFFQDTNGVQTPLPQTGIDTGMGMERLAYITQGVESNYQTDLMKGIVDGALELSGHSYEGTAKVASNVIADHIRALVFTASEGVVPDNEGRGYVIKRLLRNALKNGKKIGLNEPFLYKLVSNVTDVYGGIYEYLLNEKEKVEDIILSEEKRFFSTLDKGLMRFEELCAELKEGGKGTIPGSEAFTLFDTHGLPLEIIKEEAEAAGFDVDIEGFDKLMEKQRLSSRGRDSSAKDKYSYIEESSETEYVGEEEDFLKNGLRASVSALYSGGGRVPKAEGGEAVVIVTDMTNFYAEKGGQVGDTGTAKTDDAALVEIKDCRVKDGVVLHIGKVVKGKLKEGQDIILQPDIKRRNAVRKNHTATHMLQKALQEVLGDHAKQAGSYVGEDRLRFDFAHFKAISSDELVEIENRVNEMAAEGLEVCAKEMSIGEAKKEGAMALFGEKYGETVRLVDIGGRSKELCGGSHLTNSAEIGYFHIVQESSVASGVRRVEALTGEAAAKTATKGLSVLSALSRDLQAAGAGELYSKVTKAFDEIKQLQKEVSKLKTKGFAAQGQAESYTEINGVRFYSMILDGEDAKTMRSLADSIKEKVQDHVLVMASKGGKKKPLIVQVSKSVSSKVEARALLEKIQEKTGGKGGGKAVFAQGGFEDENAVEVAFKDIEELLKEKL